MRVEEASDSEAAVVLVEEAVVLAKVVVLLALAIVSARRLGDELDELS